MSMILFVITCFLMFQSTDSQQYCSCTKCCGCANVIVPTTATSIASKAFDDCGGGYQLNSVIISTTVTYIGQYAFEYNELLDSVSLPTSLVAISNYAFYFCIALPTVFIPTTVTFIGQYAFSDDQTLISVTFSTSLLVISSYSFYGTALKKVTIPRSVTYLAPTAFPTSTVIVYAPYSPSSSPTKQPPYVYYTSCTQLNGQGCSNCVNAYINSAGYICYWCSSSSTCSSFSSSGCTKSCPSVPTPKPSTAPKYVPSVSPTWFPSIAAPTYIPSTVPSCSSSNAPTSHSPSMAPTYTSSTASTCSPSMTNTYFSAVPTFNSPSIVPAYLPSKAPTSSAVSTYSPSAVCPSTNVPTFFRSTYSTTNAPTFTPSTTTTTYYNYFYYYYTTPTLAPSATTTALTLTPSATTTTTTTFASTAPTYSSTTAPTCSLSNAPTYGPSTSKPSTTVTYTPSAGLTVSPSTAPTYSLFDPATYIPSTQFVANVSLCCIAWVVYMSIGVLALRQRYKGLNEELISISSYYWETFILFFQANYLTSILFMAITDYQNNDITLFVIFMVSRGLMFLLWLIFVFNFVGEFRTLTDEKMWSSDFNKAVFGVVFILSIVDMSLLRLMPWKKSEDEYSGCEGYPNLFMVRCCLYGSLVIQLIQCVDTILQLVRGKSPTLTIWSIVSLAISIILMGVAFFRTIIFNRKNISDSNNNQPIWTPRLTPLNAVVPLTKEISPFQKKAAAAKAAGGLDDDTIASSLRSSTSDIFIQLTKDEEKEDISLVVEEASSSTNNKYSMNNRDKNNSKLKALFFKAIKKPSSKSPVYNEDYFKERDEKKTQT